MGYLTVVFMMLSLSLITLTFPVHRADKEKLARDYAISQLTAYYRSNNKFPNSFSIPFYPYLEYESGGSPTTSSGVPSDQAYAVVRLAGRDKQFNTADDIVISLTATQLEKDRYKELQRRARILEQAAYSICQRRLAEGITPIFPSNINDLVESGGLPDWYKYTPFGATYIYNTSSCKIDYCSCAMAIVRAP